MKNTKEPLSYKTVDFITCKTWQDVESALWPTVEEGEDDDESNTTPLCVELRNGQNDPLVAAGVFLHLRNIVSEIYCRSSEKARPVTVFSIIDEERFYRPKNVIAPLRWSDEMLERFSHQQKQDKETMAHIDLGRYAEILEGNNRGALKNFLEEIYAVNPDNKKRVNIIGSCPFCLFLMVLDWFCDAPEIFYNNTHINTKI